MSAPLIVALTIAAALSVAVVLEQRPERQIVTFSIYGTVLAIVFFLLQAPDVALSELAVGAVVAPLVVLTTLARTRRNR